MELDTLKEGFVPKYKEAGEHKFAQFLLIYALNKLIAIENKTYAGITPNVELLEYHDRFLTLYRREDDEVYLQMAKIFRRVAHKTYRVMLKKQMSDINPKFLNAVI